MSNPEVAEGLNRLFQKRGEFILIGLTGRTGSGCSTTASILSQDFEQLKLAEPNIENASPEARKQRIVNDYAKVNWHPFFTISISNVIQSYLLDEEEKSIREFFAKTALLTDPKKIDGFITSWQPAKEAWSKYQSVLESNSSQIGELQGFLDNWRGPIVDFFKTVREGLGSATATKILQTIGDNLRKSGNPFSNTHTPSRFFELPSRVAAIATTIRRLQDAKSRPTYIVLDTLRNPFELLYFRERFASFYVLAVSTQNEDRERRLSVRHGYTSKQINELDEKEYPERNTPLSGYDAFTSQNIQSCLEKADIYLTNQGFVPQNQEIDLGSLTQQLVRYISLIQHPGLVTPNRSERSMQIAFTARANSGCISRQVGAAITDSNDSIKAVGWNDVPAGQVPCLLRRATDLSNGHDKKAFSEYELKETKFRERVSTSYKRYNLVDTGGRSSSFCFKSEYNTLTKEKNQVHTRSLHAEENAFLQIVKSGGQGIQGGKLFTTASPCELCAKKAFQLGISVIYYIDPYPGISLSHVLRSGENQPVVELFQGAVGSAYHKLYEPILPFKDELRALMEGKAATEQNGLKSESRLI